jgi:lycopene cyclase domain-containing protein
MSLYFWVIIGSLAGPFFLSFDKKIHFYTYWKALFPAILLVAIPFIVWDEIFTQWGLWGFNIEHLNGLYLGSLPIEETFFFLFVPFACVFIYEVLDGYFNLNKTKRFGYYFSIIFTFLMLALGSIYFEQLYTVIACYLAATLTIVLCFLQRVDWYGKFTLNFLVVQIPFFIVNGILTGMITDVPVVWYNKMEISNYRLGTIPMEDIFYNYSMLLLIFYIYNGLKKKLGLKV